MTLAEYSIVIQWQLDDRLEWQSPDGRWIPWHLDEAPCQSFPFCHFRAYRDYRALDVREAQRSAGTEVFDQAQVS